MRKLLSFITAASLLMASASGVSAEGLKFGSRLFSDKITTQIEPNPSGSPSASPTASAQATQNPTAAYTAQPTVLPTQTVAPTLTPTAIPTATPAVTTEVPTEAVSVAESITLNKQNLELKKGEEFTLEVSAQPQTAQLGTLVWQSDNESVTVENGVVKAVSDGRAVITVLDEASKKTSSCYVDVIDDFGTLKLNITEGVKEVVVTNDGISKEVTAGSNELEVGTYEVSAKSEKNYELSDYSKTIEITAGQTPAELSISAFKTMCDITIMPITGCTITPVSGNVSPVAIDGSYSFTVTYADGINTSNASVTANGIPITPIGGIYTISPITTDITITVTGIEEISDDATLKSVKVKGYEATLGEDNCYTVTLPYGEKVTTNDIVVERNSDKATYTVTTDDDTFFIKVTAESQKKIVYTLDVKNSVQTNLDLFKEKVDALKFNDINQDADGQYLSAEQVKSEIESKVAEVASDFQGMSYTVTSISHEEPEKGEISNPTGKNGLYKFAVELSDGTETRTRNLDIVVYSYKFTIASSNITATATTVRVKNVSDDVEVSLFTDFGGCARIWETPEDGVVLFSNLSSGLTYYVKVRMQGSTQVPEVGTAVTTIKSTSSKTTRYYTVTFNEGNHGTIVEGKKKQTVKIAKAPVYPTVQADDGYIFVGWSRNGVLVEDPKDVQIRSTSSFTAIYEKSSGSAYGTNVNKPGASNPIHTPVGPTTVVFSDVPVGSWFYNSVTNICNKGYMNGISNTTFEPNSSLTRAMLVTILYRYACEPEVSGTSFSDVPYGIWYADAVTWAADAGIVNGTEPGKFDPNSNITREQLAAIMYRYCEAFGYDTSAAGNIIKYDDSQWISDWAQTALIWTTGAGIINGKDNNRLDPQGRATRAEAAAIIERFDSYING